MVNMAAIDVYTVVYIHACANNCGYMGETVMTTTRVFKSGNSLAVRLPKEFGVKSKVLEIFRRGDEIVLKEPDKSLARAFDLLTNLPDDFLVSGRMDSLPQNREEL